MGGYIARKAVHMLLTCYFIDRGDRIHTQHDAAQWGPDQTSHTVYLAIAHRHHFIRLCRWFVRRPRARGPTGTQLQLPVRYTPPP